MKKFYLLLLTIILSFSFSNAQNNVAWEEVALSVDSGNAPYVLNLMDNFYSSIDMPEGTSVSLEAIYHSPKGSPTHIINTVALSSTSACNRNPDLAHKINGLFPIKLFKIVSQFKIKLIHFGSILEQESREACIYTKSKPRICRRIQFSF